MWIRGLANLFSPAPNPPGTSLRWRMMVEISLTGPPFHAANEYLVAQPKRWHACG